MKRYFWSLDMSEMDSIKSQLLDELWLPMTIKGGNIFYPRKKKNKDLKFLTLTSDTNFKEIDLFLNKNLVQRGDTFVWNNEYLKMMRLETELGDCTVLGTLRYEKSIHNLNFSLKQHFPFDLINLDFSSQKPISEDGRIEKEMISIEKTIKFQKITETNFIIIYTTILDNNTLDLNKICDESDKLMLRRWPGLTIDEELLEGPINDNSKKIKGLNCVLSQICRKYNYSFESAEKVCINCDDENVVYSITAILRRT